MMPFTVHCSPFLLCSTHLILILGLAWLSLSAFGIGIGICMIVHSPWSMAWSVSQGGLADSRPDVVTAIAQRVIALWNQGGPGCLHRQSQRFLNPLYDRSRPGQQPTSVKSFNDCDMLTCCCHCLPLTATLTLGQEDLILLYEKL